MEKIIYNTKLKKILIVLILVMLLSNFFLPVAIATNEVFDDDLQWVFDPKWFYIKEDNSIAGFKSFVPETETPQEGWDIDEYILTDELIYKIYTIYSKGQGDSGNDKWDYATIQQGCINYNSVLAENQNKTLSDAMEVASLAGIENINVIIEIQQISAVEGVKALSAVGENLASKLGGILLTPIFFLVNFIADAITSNLGRIMIGNDASFGNITGTTVLQDNKIPLEAGKNYFRYDVDMDKLSILGGAQYPNIPYTPEEIFSGKIDLLSIDFISGKVAKTDENGDIVKDSNGNVVYTENTNEGWINIRTTIAQWYSVLRMIAIIGLLSVLIYTGIKIMISANAKDKAKYKEWIINWLMAVGILFAMHFIMAFIIAVNAEISALISQTSDGVAIINGSEESATNFMGLVRFMIQSEDFYMKIGYEAMYIALIVYTIKFTLIYLKRVLNMAFLTLIAPIVALTYPIDKINDGKAQGFDMWIKEYIFNALLQPMHLLMYYVLVGSAVSIAATNPIYGIAVLMFLTEAEKLLKRIFGFDKASGGTVGGMAGAFAAGAIASNIKNIARMSKLPGGNSGKSGSDGSGSNNTLMDNIKYDKDKGIADSGDGFSNDTFEGNSSSGGETTTDRQQEDNSEETRRQLPLEENQGSSQSEEQPQNTPQQESQSQNNLPEDSNTQDDTEEDMPVVIDDENDENDETTSNEADNNTEGEDASDASENNSIRAMAANAKNRAKTAYENNVSEGTRKKIARVGQGAWNVVDKGVIKKFHDNTREKGYNRNRWKRRVTNAGKGALKAAAGASVGIAAAAVQAGISITDGKYNPLEGAATFTAGYAGGSKLAGSVGGRLANTFNEGYYSGDAGQRELIKKKQEEFYHSDDVHKKYVNDWGAEKANTMKTLAKDNLVNFGITDTKKQKQILKLADKIAGDGGLMGATDDMKKAAVDRARRTSGFIEQLESQGQRGVIGDPDKQEKYIQAIIKSQKLDANNASDKQRIDKITKDYNAAFKSASLYYQVNK